MSYRLKRGQEWFAGFLAGRTGIPMFSWNPAEAQQFDMLDAHAMVRTLEDQYNLKTEVV